MGQYQSGAVCAHDVRFLINQIEFCLLTSMNLGPQCGGSMFWSCSCKRRCDSISSCSLYVFFFFILIACSFSRFKSSPSKHSTVTFCSSISKLTNQNVNRRGAKFTRIEIMTRRSQVVLVAIRLECRFGHFNAAILVDRFGESNGWFAIADVVRAGLVIVLNRE